MGQRRRSLLIDPITILLVDGRWGCWSVVQSSPVVKDNVAAAKVATRLGGWDDRGCCM